MFIAVGSNINGGVIQDLWVSFHQFTASQFSINTEECDLTNRWFVFPVVVMEYTGMISTAVLKHLAVYVKAWCYWEPTILVMWDGNIVLNKLGTVAGWCQ